MRRKRKAIYCASFQDKRGGLSLALAPAEIAVVVKGKAVLKSVDGFEIINDSHVPWKVAGFSHTRKDGIRKISRMMNKYIGEE